MPLVPVEKLEPGMVLAKPVTRGTMVILGEQTVLTEAWISRIADMCIENVFIDGPAVQLISREEALANLDRRFHHVEGLAVMMHIKNIVRKHIEGLYG